MREPTEKEVAAALVSVEIETRLAHRDEGAPIIEATLGPAEVLMPTQEQWVATCERAVSAELRAARLAHDLEDARRQIDNEKMLRDAVMCVSARKDRDYYVVCGIAALLGVALMACVGVMAWRLM